MAAAAGFEPTLDRAAVLVFDETLVPGRQRKSDKKHPFRRTKSVDGVSIVCAAGPGAPSAAVAVEFLAAFGVNTIVVVGSAGDLDGSLSIGPHPVMRAISDEGTSRHYDDNPGPSLEADHVLTTQLAAQTGNTPITTVTTDVPFRQTRIRLDQHRKVASTIEMECAAVFAASRHVGLRAGALLVVSDRFDDEWRMADHAMVREELIAAVATAASALGR